MADGNEVWKDPDIGAVRALLAQFSSIEQPGQDWATRRAGPPATPQAYLNMLKSSTNFRF